jgi:hypothetical protein
MRALWLLLAAACAAPHARLAVPQRLQAGLEWATVDGPLFDGRPGPNDVFQGDLDDCGLMAHLTAVAAMRPEQIEGVIRALPDGRFEVRLHPRTVVVDASFPISQQRLVFAGDAPADFITPHARAPVSQLRRPLWPLVLEKAYAELHGGYAGIDREVLDAPAELAGGTYFTVWTPKSGAAVSQAIVAEALRQRLPTTLGNAEPEAARQLGIRPAHGYAVVGIRDGAVLRLRNPTGEGGPELELPLARAVEVFRFIGIVAGDTSKLQALYEGRGD